MSAKLVELIETVTLRGHGREGDCYRNVTQWWTKDGDLVVELDKEQQPKQDPNVRAELNVIGTILDEQLGKEPEPCALRARVLAAAVGCKKWLEHEAEDRRKRLQEAVRESAHTPTRCSKRPKN